MNWLHDVSYFFAGVFLANGIPHFVSGVMGRPFQTPFAKPPGEGLSSSTTNVVWGFFNFAAGYVLTSRVGHFAWRDPEQLDDVFTDHGRPPGVNPNISYGSRVVNCAMA